MRRPMQEGRGAGAHAMAAATGQLPRTTPIAPADLEAVQSPTGFAWGWVISQDPVPGPTSDGYEFKPPADATKVRVAGSLGWVTCATGWQRLNALHFWKWLQHSQAGRCLMFMLHLGCRLTMRCSSLPATKVRTMGSPVS